MVLSFEYLDWKGVGGAEQGVASRRGATWGRLIAFSVKFMRSEPIRWEEIRTEKEGKRLGGR